MKELTAKTKTMSSREIAELTGKKHSHVKDKIKSVLNEAVIDCRNFGKVEVVGGREVTVYNLPKRECDLVMSGYSVKYRLMIIDRWQELEKTVELLPVISTDVEMKKLEVTLELAKLESQVKLAEIEAKVKLGHKKTGVRRIPNCPANFLTMKAFERSLEDVGEPIPLSFLKGLLHYYATQVDTRGNCIHEGQFNLLLDTVFASLVEEGSYCKDVESGLRVLTSKIDWYAL